MEGVGTKEKKGGGECVSGVKSRQARKKEEKRKRSEERRKASRAKNEKKTRGKKDVKDVITCRLK